MLAWSATQTKTGSFWFVLFLSILNSKNEPILLGCVWSRLGTISIKSSFFLTHSFTLSLSLFDASLSLWVCVSVFSVAFGLYKIDLMKWLRLQAEITHRHSSIFSSSTSIRYGYNQNNRFVCQESNSSPHHNHTEM